MNATVKLFSAGAVLIFLSGCGMNSEPLVSTVTPTSTPENKPVEVVGTRPVWSLDQFNRTLDFSECANVPKLNADVANLKAPYKNQEYGVEMVVAYNEAWGSSEYKIAPAEVSTIEPTGDFVAFGPLSIFGEGGCTYIRAYRMDIVSKRDKAGVMAALKANNTINSDQDILSFKEEKIGDKQVMVYSYSGMCEQFHYEVEGPKNNYVFSTFCSANVEDGANLIETIKSLKFI